MPPWTRVWLVVSGNNVFVLESIKNDIVKYKKSGSYWILSKNYKKGVAMKLYLPNTVDFVFL